MTGDIISRHVMEKRIAYIVKNVRPSLQGDALENGEHSQREIIKIGDA